MLNTLLSRIIGEAPLIQHNGQLADPLNYYAKEMKKISSNRSKTDADFEALALTEFLGSFYLSDGKVCVPGELMQAALTEAAKKRKKGPQAKAGLFCDGMFPLEYDGPKDPRELWKDEDFRLTKAAKVQRNRVMRTRPIFKEWALTFEVKYDPLQLNKADIEEFIRICGEQIGIGDWRPRYGRFSVE